MNSIKVFLNKNPAFLLLLFVYVFFVPSLLSYDHAWSFPEENFLKTVVIKDGAALQWHDLKVGLDWRGFESSVPRTTRPLSSYFEILDTKFRCWLWHYMLPHPSLSLTWIFSLVGAPVLLYRLLRYWKVSSNTAMAMTAFYLMTPAVMSYTVMLFRPAKPMANFFIILCLYQASRLQKEFLDQGKAIPAINYICFWIISALSFYWDETMWVIVPAFLVLFPRVAVSCKAYLWAWLALPFITVLFYIKIIPFLTVAAGYDFGDKLKQGGFLGHLNNLPQEFLQGFARNYNDFPQEFFRCLPGNTKNLVLDTMGIMVPDVFKASFWIKACFGTSLFAWGMLWFQLLKVKWRWDWLTVFLGALIVFFNYLMITIIGIWGPFYYGAFWSIFFVIWLGLWVERSRMSRFVLTVCFIPILLSMFYGFSAINTVYKRHHYYRYETGVIRQCFEGQKGFFDPDQTPWVSGDKLKWYVQSYWLASKQNPPLAKLSSLPRELYWLLLELEPDRPHTRYELDSTNTYIPTLIFNFR